MDYQLFRPSPSLKPYVQFYGLLQESQPDDAVTEDLIPPYPGKGLIFPLEENPPVYIRNSNFDVRAPMGYFMPQCTQSWHIRITGKFRMLGVFFRPGMLRYFFRLPATELTDRMPDFADGGFKALTALHYKLLFPARLAKKIVMVEEFLKKQLLISRTQASLTDSALLLLRRRGPSCSIDELKEQLNVSSRFLRRKFQRDIGISPKLFLRIYRFNAAFQLIQAGQYNKLTDIAYQLNYADQSHFIREFKRFAGAPPLRFLKQEHPLQNRIYWRG